MDRRQALLAPQPTYAEPAYAEPQPQAAPAPATEPAYVAELQKVAELKTQGLITEAEYEAKKKQILGI